MQERQIYHIRNFDELSVLDVLERKLFSWVILQTDLLFSPALGAFPSIRQNRSFVSISWNWNDSVISILAHETRWDPCQFFVKDVDHPGCRAFAIVTFLRHRVASFPGCQRKSAVFSLEKLDKKTRRQSDSSVKWDQQIIVEQSETLDLLLSVAGGIGWCQKWNQRSFCALLHQNPSKIHTTHGLLQRWLLVGWPSPKRQVDANNEKRCSVRWACQVKYKLISSWQNYHALIFLSAMPLCSSL